MSKRAKEIAYEFYPVDSTTSVLSSEQVDLVRMGCIFGYEQAEKDTIERAIKWLKENWREYVWMTDNGIPHFGHWENDFRKAMEEE